MPINIEKQIKYWSEGAGEDMETADYLMKGGRMKEALFYTHLALEKALKALVVKAVQDVPPYIHNLSLLAERTELAIPKDTLAFLADMNQYNVMGRYPDLESKTFSKDFTRKTILRAKEVIQWLIEQL